MAWYSASSGSTNSTSATSIHFIGRSRSVSASGTAPALLRAAAKPLLIPASSDLRSENSVHTPPTSIAPTPRKRILDDQMANAASAAGAPAMPAASCGSLPRNSPWYSGMAMCQDRIAPDSTTMPTFRPTM